MSDWYYAQNGQQNGPIPSAELRQLAHSGRLHPADMVWRDGMSQWAPAASVPDLFPPGIAPPPLPRARPVMQAGDAAATVSPDLATNAGMRWLLPVGRSGWAIAAGYLGLISLLAFPALIAGVNSPGHLGLLSLLAFPSLIAVVISIIALVDLHRHPRRRGLGRAIFGLVMGIFGSVALVLLLFALWTSPRRQFLPGTHPSRHAAPAGGASTI